MEKEGAQCFLQGDQETRDWFLKQWKEWPTRVDPMLTTNASFHHGAILAFKELHGCYPTEVSEALGTYMKVAARWMP